MSDEEKDKEEEEEEEEEKCDDNEDDGFFVGHGVLGKDELHAGILVGIIILRSVILLVSSEGSNI